VPGQRLVSDVDDLGTGLGEEALGGGANGDVVAGDLDLGNAFQRDRHALACVHVVGDDLDSHDLQQERIHTLQDGPDEGPPALDDTIRLDFARLAVARAAA